MINLSSVISQFDTVSETLIGYIDELTSPCVLVNQLATIAYCNAAFKFTFGFETEGALANKSLNKYVPDSARSVAFAELLSKQGAFLFEAGFDTIHGKKLEFSVSAGSLNETEADMLRLAVFNDVSEERKLYSKFRELDDDVKQSMRFASRIQQAVMPSLDILKEYCANYWADSQARDVLNGDFLWAHEKDNSMFVAVSDCTGHGVAGSLLTMLGVQALNSVLDTTNELDTNYILDRVHDYMVASNARVQAHEANEIFEFGMDVAFVRIRPISSMLQFTGANRPLIHLSDTGVKIYRGTKRSIGQIEFINGHCPTFDEIRIPYQNRDCFYMFSDGVTDQLGSATNKRFGLNPLVEVLTNIWQLPLTEQRDHLRTTFTRWKGVYPQTDDVSFVCLRF
jgi:serine phosphatase RsbU (regulator of sigma subunit)